MKITSIEPFILHVPVSGGGIADSSNSLTHWGVIGVVVETDAGPSGTGYTGTLAHLPTDRLIRDCIEHSFGPMLVGQNPLEVRGLWEKLYNAPAIRWVGRAGITQMALAAIDVALWDIKAKAARMPLWQLLGGSDEEPLVAYNTDGGWLNWSLDQLVADARASVDAGFRAIKLKVGSPYPEDDLRRIEAVRDAIGPKVDLMIDGNGRWDLPTVLRFARRLAEFDVFWFEEPTWYDDVAAHATLARAVHTPIALGEQLYSLDDFRRFVEAGAVHYVQPDATRLGGITPWWRVAELALASRLPVVAHAADMMQIHQHVSIAHSACRMFEYIPWLRECFEEPATVVDGLVQAPRLPGASTTLRPEALSRFGVN